MTLKVKVLTTILIGLIILFAVFTFILKVLGSFERISEKQLNAIGIFGVLNGINFFVIIELAIKLLLNAIWGWF